MKLVCYSCFAIFGSMDETKDHEFVCPFHDEEQPHSLYYVVTDTELYSDKFASANIQFNNLENEEGRRALFSHATDDWATPRDFYSKLNEDFRFDFDPCPLIVNRPSGFDGLRSKWGQSNFVNPPYSDVKTWIRKAITERESHQAESLFLIHARTDTKWFHELVRPHATEIGFVKNRLVFTTPEGTSKGNAPFPSMLANFGTRRHSLDYGEKVWWLSVK